MTDPSIDGLFQALDADEARHDRSSSTAPAGFEAADVQAGKADKPTNIRAVSTLFVRRIPRDTTNDMLEEFFSEIGPIRSCFVVADKSADDGEDEPETDKDPAFRNRGFGFVQYALPEDAKRAMEELERVNFRGEKPLLLEYAIKKRVKLEDDAKKEAKIPSEAEKPVVDTTDPKHAAKSSKKPFKKDPGTKPIPSRTII
ncbi:RNA recognition motif-containing protein, partial [Spiromyces aspiralis]